MGTIRSNSDLSSKVLDINLLYLSVAEGEFKFSIPIAFFHLYSNSTGIISLFVVIKPPTGRSDILFTSPFCPISTDNDDFFGRIYLLPNERIL